MINGPRATLYYKALYSILQCTTAVRLLFYKVLLQYDSANTALVRTTKYSSVLGRPTPYYAVVKSTAPYYKVLLQYILQSTTPVLLCTSQITPNVRLPQKLTLQHHQIMRLPREVTLQHDRILRLPRKVTP